MRLIPSAARFAFRTPVVRGWLVSVLTVAAFGACGGSTSSTPGSGGTGGSPEAGVDAGEEASVATPDDECVGSDDCTWGEIGHDILAASDCPCLFGCPGLPQNKTVETRRMEQYRALCDPHMDGQGNLCGVDDCIVPPPLTCVGGKCTAPRM
jgi:hypothetical protein